MPNTRQSFGVLVATWGMFFTLAVSPVMVSAAEIMLANHSFEVVDTLQVGGIWPEADVDPVNADAWLEPGPVDGDWNAFPPELIPAGFTPSAGATLDTGIFYNSPVNQDPDTGQFVPNPSFVTNADGNQVAYLFAKDDLQPSIGFVQHLGATYDAGEAYVLTVGVGKSFFLPPFGGNQGDPALGLRLLYLDTQQTTHVVAATTVATSAVFSTTLTDVSIATAPVGTVDPWHGRPLAIEILPVDGDSGVWIFDNVRIATVPEPGLSPLWLSLALAGVRRRRLTRRSTVEGGGV